jgi:hypothetical protein
MIATACGHEVTTGSARNDWDTPTGHASATDPRYINPMAAGHPVHDRSVFAKREAPPQQSPPPEEALPPPTTVVPEETLPRDSDVPPPYVTPIQPQP